MSQAKFKNKNNSENRDSSGTYSRAGRYQILGILFFVTVVGLLGLSGITLYKWANDAQRQPIARLIITGDRVFTTDDDIRHAILALGMPSSLIGQNVNVLRQQIERLPWIQTANIKKEWPDKLRIDIKEFKPVVKWNQNYLLDNDANVFSLPPERIIKLPLVFLNGSEGQEKIALSAFKEMQKLVTGENRLLVAASISDRNSWILSVAFLENGNPEIIKIELGQNDYLGRLTRFLHLFPELKKLNPGRQIVNIDMRYETGAAVTWAPAVEQ